MVEPLEWKLGNISRRGFMSNRQFAANGFVVSVHALGGWGYTVHLGSWDVWGDVLMPVEDKGVREGAPKAVWQGLSI